MTAAPVLVACSHGTRDPRGRAAVAGLVGAVRERLDGHAVVLEAFVDVQRPEVSEVLDAVAGAAVVVPLLLSAGYHVHHDVAGAVAGHADRGAALPLGPAPELAAIQVERLRAAGADDGDVVVLGASASSHPRAAADVERAVELLAAQWPGPVVGAGQVGHCGTPLADVVDAARRRYRRRVVVSSYLLAPGHFHRQLETCGADLTTSPLLDGRPHGRLVDLVVERYRRARTELTSPAVVL